MLGRSEQAPALPDAARGGVLRRRRRPARQSRAGAADCRAGASRRRRRAERSTASSSTSSSRAACRVRSRRPSSLRRGTRSSSWPELSEWRGGRLDAIPREELEQAFVGALRVTDEEARFLGGESLGEALDRVQPAVDRLRRPRVGHRPRGAARRRQQDRPLLRPHRRAHVPRRLRAGAGVPRTCSTSARRLDRAHRQLRPVRPAPPGARDDDGAPLGAVAAVSRRARVAPRTRPRPCSRYAPRITAQLRIRSSSSPAAAKAASRRSVTSRRIRYGSGFQRNDGTSYSGSPSIGFGSIATAPRGEREDVVVVEVAVDERVATDLERRVELARQRDELVPGGVVEPARHVVADPAERLGRRPPEPKPDRRRAIRGRLVLGEPGDVVAGPAARAGAPAARGRAGAAAPRRRRPRASSASASSSRLVVARAASPSARASSPAGRDE